MNSTTPIVAAASAALTAKALPDRVGLLGDGADTSPLAAICPPDRGDAGEHRQADGTTELLRRAVDAGDDALLVVGNTGGHDGDQDDDGDAETEADASVAGSTAATNGTSAECQSRATLHADADQCKADDRLAADAELGGQPRR